MNILVLNCGSSSIKYQVIDMTSSENYELLAKGLVERIGIENGILTHRPTGKEQVKITTDIPDHTVGIALIIKAICLILGALGLANMWIAIIADVGVMILAVLNAIRCLFVKNL